MSFHKRAAVDPLYASVPAFYARRIEQILSHIGISIAQSMVSGDGRSVLPTSLRVPITTSVGFFTLANRDSLKKSAFNMNLSVVPM
ncbi:MAG: hypothetical protein Ct9H300mP19_02100 [Dehalococcoidia bacterium]|nr:MAG: hypothetical protein Ct9H300mP19_02100 [Dehalococcoidia bacterium]